VPLVRYLEAAPTPMPTLRYVTNSGGALPGPILDALPRVFPGARIHLMYGLTEAFRSTALPPERFAHKRGSIGRAVPNVETFVVFRASTPLVIGIAEWWFMGRELPNARSAAAMLTLCAGAVFYVLTDASFKVDPDVSLGYAWVVVWYVIFSFDQLYIKHAVDTVKMRSNWGRVYYTNLWASILLFWLTLATEPQTLTAMQWTFKPVAALSLSCAAGVAMSYFAFLCRAAVSATSFTVIGNVCKVLAPRNTCRGRLPHRPAALGGAPTAVHPAHRSSQS
jgi:hypothetical protein